MMNPLIALAVFPLLGLAVLFALLRIFRGPTTSDRVLALDSLAAIGVGIMCAHAVYTEHPVFLDAALILALLSFLTTVAFSTFLVRSGQS